MSKQKNFILIQTLFGLMKISNINNDKVIQSNKTQQDYSVPKRAEAIDKSNKLIPEKLSIRSVREDVTSNWRLCTLANSDMINIEKYILDYYKKYFLSNDEIHAIINFANNTTTRIISNGFYLSVTVFDYVENEEHSAKTLFSGTELSDYNVYLDNGDIEKIK